MKNDGTLIIGYWEILIVLRIASMFLIPLTLASLNWFQVVVVVSTG